MTIAKEARSMLRGHRCGALCTLSKRFDGHPFGSITPFLVDHDGSLLILISALAEHTKNIKHDSRVSLITHEQQNTQILAQGRVTVLGNARQETDREQVGQRYLRYFPEAHTYFAMQDFSFFRIRPVAIRLIGGFGKIHWINMEEYAVEQFKQYAQQEESLLAEMNATQQIALRQQLLQQHAIDAENALAIGLDCDGIDVRSDGQTWRLSFPATNADPSPDELAALNWAVKAG